MGPLSYPLKKTSPFWSGLSPVKHRTDTNLMHTELCCLSTSFCSKTHAHIAVCILTTCLFMMAKCQGGVWRKWIEIWFNGAFVVVFFTKMPNCAFNLYFIGVVYFLPTLTDVNYCLFVFLFWFDFSMCLLLSYCSMPSLWVCLGMMSICLQQEICCNHPAILCVAWVFIKHCRVLGFTYRYSIVIIMKVNVP